MWAELGGQHRQGRGRGDTELQGQQGQIFLNHQFPKQVRFLSRVINLERRKEKAERGNSKEELKKGSLAEAPRPGLSPREPGSPAPPLLRPSNFLNLSVL